MKSKPVRFGRAIVLSIFFFVTVFSLLGSHDGSNSGWTNVHIWAGSLMLIGSAVHLATNLDWVRAVFSRPASSLKKRVRQNHRTDLGLFISGTICQSVFASYAYMEPYFHIYGAFYEITQLSLIFIAAVCIARSEDRKARFQIADLQTGALLYVVPSFFIAAVRPEVTDKALPSIMCHFALFFAVFLVRLNMRERKS